MPARLVYAPKAYVFTKAQDGTLYNLTPYVTGGQVQRKVEQVSSATVTLRNPYRLFTTPGAGVAFHPMDPITIYLERIAGYPVRVFTGYLDTTPYYQLQPGEITLEASCTLKRLLYTYFDPSLPYMIAFFEKYGWINRGDGSIVSKAVIDTQGVITQGVASKGEALQDGSFSKLLWATLYDIAEWDDSNIWIEPLPSGPNGIVQRMELLMKTFQASQTQASNDFTSFLTSVIGNGGQGSGGGAGAAGSGNLSNASGLTVKGGAMSPAQATVANTLLDVCSQYHASQLIMESIIVAGIFESSLDSSNTLQSITANSSLSTQQQAVGYLTANPSDWKGAIRIAKANPSITPIDLATQTEGAYIRGTTTSQYTQEGSYPIVPGEATKIVNRYLQGSVSPGRVTTNQGIGGMSVASSAAASQAGSTAPASGAGNPNRVINPIPGFSGFSFDFGIDCSAPIGSAILAPAACTVVGSSYDPHWFQGTYPYLAFKFDNPLPGAPSQHWYISEGIRLTSTTDGHHFNQGDTVAVYTGPPIEIGWADDSNPGTRLAQAKGLTDHSGTGGNTPQNIYGRHFLNYFSIGGGSPQKAGAIGTAGGSSQGGNSTSTASAQAFVGVLDIPSIEDSVVALALGAEHKGLMHDQSVMPFVQQLTQASMRSFMSLPNGDFFAFYPDYFGEMGHRDPYWLIDDIEILSGTISLSDDALSTHVFAVGDNTWPANSELLNQLFSAGTISVFNAFLSEDVIDSPTAVKPSKKGTKQVADSVKGGGLADVLTTQEAVDFVKRYGARPLVQDYPMVRSPIYEMLMAYQLFMTAWSNQFKTPFEFTFMPELFPGGKVGFPTHGIKMYIKSVTHSWSYAEGGFTTSAELTAPSLYTPNGTTSADFPDIPPNMVSAMAEPIKKDAPKGNAAQIENTVGQAISSVLPVTNAGHGTVS